MMKFNNIHFILNPISGKGKGEEVNGRIQELFSGFNIQIKVTQGKHDAYNFTLKSLEQGVDLIVSCGGDGTLNEVASALVGKNTPLSIVPIGSGNGLARHLQIPLEYEKALQMILKSEGKIENIDCGKINNTYFFSNAGIGFDAEAVKIYSHQKQRQLVGYVKSVLLSVFKFKPVEISLESDNNSFKGKVMMLNISNSNCMGYGFSISPKASLQDGKFDINLVSKCSWFLFSWIGLGFLINKVMSNKHTKSESSKLKIEVAAEYIQVDGEYHPLETKTLEISMHPASLRVVIA